MRRLHGTSGFTLIEIMVVVFILGLLVTLVAPKIIGRTDEARRVKARADIKGIEEALHLFKLDTGTYPSASEGINVLIQGGGGRGASPDGYLPKVPVDPWGNEYIYFSDGRNFVIKSYGPDGSDGGNDNNADISSED